MACIDASKNNPSVTAFAVPAPFTQGSLYLPCIIQKPVQLPLGPVQASIRKKENHLLCRWVKKSSTYAQKINLPMTESKQVRQPFTN